MNQETTQPTPAEAHGVAPASQERDWDAIVESTPTMFHLPTTLTDRAKEWDKRRRDFEEQAAKLAEMESELSMFFQQLIHDARKHLSENGVPRAFTMDTGFNNAALEDGKFIINIDPNRRG